MHRWFWLWMAAGCTTGTLAPATGTDVGSSDEWWTNGSDNGSNDTPSDPNDFDAQDAEDEELDDEEDGPPEAENLWWFAMAGDEAWEGFYNHDGTTLLCESEYELRVQGPATGCDACESAWRLQRASQEHVEDNGGCQAIGALGLEGTTVEVGLAGNQAFINTGSGWEVFGYAEREQGEVFFERFIGEDGQPEFDEDDDDE